MEQTKAKTAEGISFYNGSLNIDRIKTYTALSENFNLEIGTVRDIFCAGLDFAQSHIANLEAEKADLERLSQSDQKHITSIEKQNSQYIKLIDRFVKSPKNGMIGMISNLEAQNKELREALKKIGLLYHEHDRMPLSLLEEATEIAEQALKEDKQDG